ncbi:hypothetical protein [Haloplasma contractile]|uniref:Uncharacterized protein n=1 Tax=Haloplasma contractile SSD-17B TaxID=1033810 RepID=U2EAL8_9MOLU|nr:hypothetical protein [Haloplasma contractile]ERJ11866.1 hypothetical protein HLPCO_002106 [Haloplasma contractile SSD-17B]
MYTTFLKNKNAKYVIFTAILLFWAANHLSKLMQISTPALEYSHLESSNTKFYFLILLAIPLYSLIVLYLPSLLISKVSVSFEVPPFRINTESSVYTFRIRTNKCTKRLLNRQLMVFRC